MGSQETPAPARVPDDKTAKPPAAGGRPLMASFLDHLVRSGTISAELAEKATAVKQKNSSDRRTVLEILRDDFGVSRDTLQFQVAQFYAFRTIEFGERATRRMPAPEIMKLLKALPDQLRSLAMKQKVLPYGMTENQFDKLIVVTPNPSDRETSEVARSFPYKKFEICYMKEGEWDELWRQVSSDRSAGQQQAPTLVDIPSEESEGDLDDVLDREIARAQLASLVENVFADAVRVSATAIHFVPKADRKTDVYFRIDGVVSQWYSIDDVRAEAVATMLKLRTPGMDRYERLSPQVGALQKSADGCLLNFRVSSMPVAVRGFVGKFELIVVRIEREPEGSWKLETLGLSEAMIQAFREALALRRGLVLLTGPDGSGLTTTMAAMMRSIAGLNHSAIALEESMEFTFEGVCHVRLTPKMTYDEALAMIERQDPDVVVLGEIKDRREADLALRMAMSGRRVFATMQAGDAVGAVIRLHGLGVEPYMLAQALSLVHAQRLVRRLCPHCRETRPEPDPRLERMGFSGQNLTAYRPVGCIECVGGFDGRIPLHETFVMTSALRTQMPVGMTPDQTVLRSGLVAQQSLKDAATRLLHEGLTTVDEVWTALF